MDLSALIFVALAVAWAVYLIPKALKHHEDDLRSRTVDNFSTSMRVLASREPVDSRTARLTVNGQAVVAPAPPVASRTAAAGATKRRRRVLSLILLVGAGVGTVVGFGLIPVVYLAAPVGLLVAWLVACRVMVKSERAGRTATPSAAPTPARRSVAEDGPVTEEIEVVPATVERVPGSWDPVPVTLPTYVSKEPAGRRTVRTIDLDSTGVWTSGHDESDSRLAREADETERTAAPVNEDDAARRATGS